jgi:MFS family permease
LRPSLSLSRRQRLTGQESWANGHVLNIHFGSRSKWITQSLGRAELDFSLARRNSSLGAIFASSFAFGLTFGGFSALVSLILEGRDFSEVLTSLNSAMGAGSVSCFAPLHQTACALWCRGFTLRLLGLFIGASALFPWFDDYYAWLALRFAIGAGIAIPWVLSRTWTNQIAPPRMRGRIMAIYSTTIAAGSLTLAPS